MASVLMTDLVVVRGNHTADECIEQILRQPVMVAAYGFGPEFILLDSCNAHHQRCLARTGHSRDGVTISEP
jgi:hypothetical protein